MTTTTLEAGTVKATRTQPTERARPKKQPAYHVILLDDDDHTYEYVIGMLRKLFGFTAETAYQLACEVDQKGLVILDTTTLERAELKRDQIHAFGRDWRIARCEGSMTSVIEPAPE
jgi:ATP-dependent Clp protease adaptor protein ClpS